ncbi:hypothetical protein DL96DRAFT_998614 [Flagelloscypha sp. PMI_526]|nr:hypothetical protein DL96DRAFT_998614 [Flagelloscypha sp. PMI_526]
MPGDEKSGIALLSLDGGRFENLGALTQIHVVEDILDQYEFEKGLERGTVKVPGVFDFIVGTGTGGLVACMLGPLKMSTKDAKKAYLQIWETKFWSKTQISERVQILKKALTDLLDSQTEGAKDVLSTIQMTDVEKLNPSCKFAVTASTTARSAKPVMLQAYRSRGGFVECTVLEALLATLAHEDILPPVPIGQGISELFAAPTVEHCNPTDALLEEIPTIFTSSFISVIVNIGSGRPNPIEPGKPSDFAKAFVNHAKSSQTVSQIIESRFTDHPGSFVRLEVDGFDLLDLLHPGKAISYSRAYLVRKETKKLVDTIVHSLIMYPNRLGVGRLAGFEPETAEMSSEILDRGYTMQPPHIREQLTISGNAPNASTTAKNIRRSSSNAIKTILPSHRLSPAELEKRLKKILGKWEERSGINSVYKPIVDSALSMEHENDTKQRWTILHAIISIAEPSSIAFVAGLLGVNPQLVAAVVQSLYPVLITADMEGPIYICHESFREFVLSCTSGKFGYHPPSIHLLFAQACVREMAISLRFNICNLESSFIPDIEIQPSLKERTARHIGALLTYASRNWWFHIKGCDDVGKLTILPNVEKMLQEKGIFWIEVMSLLGEMKICQEIFTELVSSSAIILMVPSVHLLASEASKLVSLFEAIPEKITSHIYLTCLALSEITPDLDCWRTQFWSLPKALTEQEPREHDLDDHLNCVTSTTFSPNGKYIVSTSEDPTVRVWDAQSGRKVRQLRGHTGPVSSAAFSPDDRRIVSASHDRSIRIWDVESGEMLQQLNGHTGCVQIAAFSLDGMNVISVCEDKTVCRWDAESGVQLRRLSSYTDNMFSVAFSPDGKQIASSCRNHFVHVWDVESGKELQRFSGHTDWVYSVAFSPNGRQVVSGSGDRTVHIWDAESGSKLRQCNGHTDSVQSVAFSPNGKWLVSGSRDRSIRIWDAESGRLVRQLEGHTRNVKSVAFSPDGNYVVSGSHDRTIRLWKIDAGSEFRQFGGQRKVICSVVFSPQVKRVLQDMYHQALETPMPVPFIAKKTGMQKVTAHSMPESSQNVSAQLPVQSQFSPASQPPIELPESPHLPNAVILSPTSFSLHCRVDGWLVVSKEVTGAQQKIIWIPPAFRPFHPQVVLVISREEFNGIDLAGCTFGEGWERCYTGGI